MNPVDEVVERFEKNVEDEDEGFEEVKNVEETVIDETPVNTARRFLMGNRDYIKKIWKKK